MKKKIKIVIDCGHGGIDPRTKKYTTAPSKQAMVGGEMIHEGVINRTIGGMLAHLLKWDSQYDFEVIFSVHPDDHRDISLPHRVRVANQHPDALFISIHSNAFNGRARGYEIFTSKGQTNSDKLAQCIFDRTMKVGSEFGLPMRKDKTDGDDDKEVDFYVLKKTKGTAVLIECFFFDNVQDLGLYRNEYFLGKFVSAQFNGIKDYIKTL